MDRSGQVGILNEDPQAVIAEFRMIGRKKCASGLYRCLIQRMVPDGMISNIVLDFSSSLTTWVPGFTSGVNVRVGVGDGGTDPDFNDGG